MMSFKKREKVTKIDFMDVLNIQTNLNCSKVILVTFVLICYPCFGDFYLVVKICMQNLGKTTFAKIK